MNSLGIHRTEYFLVIIEKYLYASLNLLPNATSGHDMNIQAVYNVMEYQELYLLCTDIKDKRCLCIWNGKRQNLMCFEQGRAFHDVEHNILW